VDRVQGIHSGAPKKRPDMKFTSLENAGMA